jgi:hypothetical protein
MTRWLSRLAMAALVAATAVSAGCPAAPSNEPAPQGKKPAATDHIIAVTPADMAAQVSRRPVLKWALPENFKPTIVSVTIYNAGRGAEPNRNVTDADEVAYASGVTTDAAGQLDLLSPPASVILTGDLRGAPQLAPMTWYKWKVRANTGGQPFLEDSFTFRTDLTEAPLPIRTQTSGFDIPPLPKPLPPQPIEKNTGTAPSKTGKK